MCGILGLSPAQLDLTFLRTHARAAHLRLFIRGARPSATPSLTRFCMHYVRELALARSRMGRGPRALELPRRLMFFRSRGFEF